MFDVAQAALCWAAANNVNVSFSGTWDGCDVSLSLPVYVLQVESFCFFDSVLLCF